MNLHLHLNIKLQGLSPIYNLRKHMALGSSYMCGFFFFFFSTQVQVETRILDPTLIVLKNWAWFTAAKLA